MKTYEVEVEIIETYVVEAENAEIAKRQAEFSHVINWSFCTAPENMRPHREIVSAVAEEIGLPAEL